MDELNLQYVDRINKNICDKLRERHHMESIECARVPCIECARKYKFKYEWCCLIYCGESEFCRGCERGAYTEEFRKDMERPHE